MVHVIYFFTIKYQNFCHFVFGCLDRFSFFFKCPLPPVTITINVAEFCRDAKKHVDCVNRRLENCTEVQEYGPALGKLKLFGHISESKFDFFFF